MFCLSFGHILKPGICMYSSEDLFCFAQLTVWYTGGILQQRTGKFTSLAGELNILLT